MKLLKLIIQLLREGGGISINLEKRKMGRKGVVPDFNSSARSSAEAGVCKEDQRSLNSTPTHQYSSRPRIEPSEKERTIINLSNTPNLIQKDGFHLTPARTSEWITLRSRNEHFSVLL